MYESNKAVFARPLDSNMPSAHPAFSCRRLATTDFARWDRLFLAQMREEGAPVSQSAEEREGRFRRTLSVGCGWWGLFDGDDLVTIVALDGSYKTTGHLAGLYTAVHRRRQGFARAITAAFMHDCWHSGIRRTVLLVNDDNLPARDLYSSFGFEASDRFGFLFGAVD